MVQLDPVTVNSKADIVRVIQNLSPHNCSHCQDGTCDCEQCAGQAFCPVCGLLIPIAAEDRKKEQIICPSSVGQSKGFEHSFPPSKLPPANVCLKCNGEGTVQQELRTLLFTGLDLVKKRQELTTKGAGKFSFDGAEMHCWVDLLIRDRMGGRRDGLTVVWDLPEDGRYVYDPYKDELTEPDAS